MKMTPELEVAVTAADQAGEILMRHLHDGVEIRSKDVANLVSDADLEAERSIIKFIHSHFPEHAILAEEEGLRGAENAEHLWIVDPLDGTNNFAHQIPHFAVSIGYYHRGEPQCGVVLNPARGDRFIAIRGGGAFLNGKPMQVSDHSQLDQVFIGVGFFYDRGAMMEATLRAIADLFRENIHGIRRFGTASLDLCMVGCGQFGAFFEYHLAPWDFAVGRLFVEEAGGRVTDCRGNPLPIGATTLLASNSKLHDAVLALAGRHLPG